VTDPERPAWTGQGPDPWLPQRLEARMDVLRTERDIRETFWAQLSDWLVRLSRRVLRGDGRSPDMDAVWALAPAWRDAVDLVISGAILPAMQRAYRATVGAEFDLESRPFLARYLAEVRNRMARVPEETFDLIAGQVSAGVNMGESIPKLAARIEETFSLTATPRWENRATVTARTEAIGALNAARAEAFKVFKQDWAGGEELERVWLSTSDSRTRETHRLADGQRVAMDQPFIVGGAPLMFPGDPSGPPQEVIQCRCTVLLVERGESVDLSNRQMKRGRS
jgi:hypothetical protein